MIPKDDKFTSFNVLQKIIMYKFVYTDLLEKLYNKQKDHTLKHD